MNGASESDSLTMSVLHLLNKRQAVFEEDYDEDVMSTTEALLVEEPPTGVSLAQILGDNYLRLSIGEVKQS